jgi:hypothetical protein
MFIRLVDCKRLQVSADSEMQSIKIAIQTLAYRLWLEKRAFWADDIDWLVDGRLMDQLNELPKDQLLRVSELLSRKTGDKGKRIRLMTFRIVIAPQTPD